MSSTIKLPISAGLGKWRSMTSIVCAGNMIAPSVYHPREVVYLITGQETFLALIKVRGDVNGSGPSLKRRTSQESCLGTGNREHHVLETTASQHMSVGLSLTIMNYGDTVRLGVMSDALLSPQHSVIATGFLQQLSDLARCAGIPRDRSNSLYVIPQPPSTTNIGIVH
uniref:Uncharacterized protein n=1 Tax=Timema bartmani TaxID=61472 RepID=A0A7R9FCH4_9NEOP|nr:unnamed protein product [Timema bartmani]